MYTAVTRNWNSFSLNEVGRRINGIVAKINAHLL